MDYFVMIMSQNFGELSSAIKKNLLNNLIFLFEGVVRRAEEHSRQVA